MDQKLTNNATCEEIVTFQGLANADQLVGIKCDGSLMKSKITQGSKSKYKVTCIDKTLLPSDGSPYIPICKYKDVVKKAESNI